jgi:hypothetical protein
VGAEAERERAAAAEPSLAAGEEVGSEPARVLPRGEEPVSPRARCGRDDALQGATGGV